MPVYQVQLWPDGKWDGKEYRRVEAGTPKEAAEKLCGCPLSERGSMSGIRAQVRLQDDLKKPAIIYYAA